GNGPSRSSTQGTHRSRTHREVGHFGATGRFRIAGMTDPMGRSAFHRNALALVAVAAPARADHVPQQLTFYTQAVSTGAALTIVAGAYGLQTTPSTPNGYKVVNQANGNTIATGTLNAYATASVPISNGAPVTPASAARRRPRRS